MSKKLVLLLALVMSFSLVAFGCGGGKTKIEVKTPEQAAKMEGDPVQNLAVKEKEWLGRLDAVRGDISKSYSEWEQGKTTKEDFMNQLKKSNGTVRGMSKEYDLHMEANPFPADRKNEEFYKDGLAYGNKLRKTANDFIFMATEGILDTQTKKLKPLTDEQIKGLYQNYMANKYDEYRAKLVPALDKVNKK